LRAGAEEPSWTPHGDTSTIIDLASAELTSATIAQLEEWRAHLVSFIDRLASGVLVVSVAGLVVYETPMLERMLADDPERNRLRRALVSVAQRIGAAAHHRCDGATYPRSAGAPSMHEERTANAHYHIWGSYIAPGLLAPSATVLAVLERVHSQPLSNAQIRERFGLTPRELEVALLADRGASARVIARTLAISTHTARHHLERVRGKLGAHRIGEAVARLREG
jgi:DNA-binding CsgD family transcriptional regulator